MKKICFDRLPNIVLSQFRSIEDWDSLSAIEQRKRLLDTHDGLLTINDDLVKLLLEMEQ